MVCSWEQPNGEPLIHPCEDHPADTGATYLPAYSLWVFVLHVVNVQGLKVRAFYLKIWLEDEVRAPQIGRAHV